MSKVTRLMAVLASCALIAAPVGAGAATRVASTQVRTAKLIKASAVASVAKLAGIQKSPISRLMSSTTVRASAVNDIPGESIPESPVSGTMDQSVSSDDVYSVWLESGQTISVSMTADDGTDFGIYLYAPGTSTVIGNTDFVASSYGSYPATFTYVAPASGTYYLDECASEVPGAYSIDYTLDGTSLASDDEVPGVSIPASPISDTLDSEADVDDVYAVALVAGQQIDVSMTADDGTDFDIYLYPPGTSTVNGDEDSVAESNGESYPEHFTYTAVTSGTYYLDACANDGSGSYTIDYKIKSPARVYAPIAPSTMRRGRAASIYGYVAPAHSSGTYLVSLKFYLRNSHGTYVLHHSVNARRYAYSSSRSKYKASVALPHAGKWRVRAYHSDAGHAPSYGGYDYITVR